MLKDIKYNIPFSHVCRPWIIFQADLILENCFLFNTDPLFREISTNRIKKELFGRFKFERSCPPLSEGEIQYNAAPDPISQNLWISTWVDLSSRELLLEFDIHRHRTNKYGEIRKCFVIESKLHFSVVVQRRKRILCLNHKRRPFLMNCWNKTSLKILTQTERNRPIKGSSRLLDVCKIITNQTMHQDF